MPTFQIVAVGAAFKQNFNMGTRIAEVLNRLIMKIRAKENDMNGLLQTFRYLLLSLICNALMMITGVMERSAKCRSYHFLWQ